MNDKRIEILIGLFLLGLMGGFVAWQKQQHRQRVHDYADAVAEAQHDVQAFFRDFKNQNARAFKAESRGEFDEPAVADCLRTLTVAVDGTKERADRFSNIVAPQEGEELRTLALEFFDQKRQFAITAREFYLIYQKWHAEAGVPDVQVGRLSEAMSRDADLARKLDRTVVQKRTELSNW